MAGFCRSVLRMRKPKICSDLEDNKKGFSCESATLLLGFESVFSRSLFF